MTCIPDFYRQIHQTIAEKTDTALATVIARTGSGPREPGAMMLVCKEGLLAGTVGGGGLEAQVIDTAQTVLKTGHAVCQTFTLTAEMAATDGMICGGTMEVLIDPLLSENSGKTGVFKKLLHLIKARQPVWLITAMDGEPGHLETGVGFFAAQEMDTGTLPLSEAAVRSLISEADPRLPTLADAGKRRIFVQPIRLPEPVFIFGAGHIAEPLVPACRAVGFYPIVLDDRADFAAPDRFPDAGEIVLLDRFAGCFNQLDIDDQSYLVVITRGHAHDRTVIEQALNTPARYIGMIGSRKKRDAIYAMLRQGGYTEKDLNRIYSPIGLAIGAQTPAEIAVSILAEMIAVRTGRHPGKEMNPRGNGS
jgi:xanthine dehydrogenase accessory factor